MNFNDFTKTAVVLKNLIEEQKARVMFENNTTSLTLSCKLPEELADIEDLDSIMDEILEIMILTLTNNEELYKRCQQDKEYADKVELVQKEIVNDELIRRHQFFTNPTITPVRTITLSPIIRPSEAEEKYLVTCLMIIEYRNISGSVKRFEAEMNIDQVKRFAEGLQKIYSHLDELNLKLKGLDLTGESIYERSF